jgi:nucleoside 2-deoxyribosyltransferase
MLDKTVGVLLNPPPETKVDSSKAKISSETQAGYAFVAMAIDKNDHQLVDVLEAIKEVSKDFGIEAERIDEAESNERITTRILSSIRRAEYVIVDLTNEKPNVFYEAGYAEGKGKTPIYIARDGTKLHFDVKNYPIINFRNMKELKDGLRRRMTALIKDKSSPQ